WRSWAASGRRGRWRGAVGRWGGSAPAGMATRRGSACGSTRTCSTAPSASSPSALPSTRTGDLNWKFSYEIEAASTRNPENCLQLKASVTNAKEWAGLRPTKAFLLVPYDFCSSTNLTLNLSIGRSASV
uniref:Uncharacterized protein n=1 Tax=Aegilops tauschii subsp. strangulata TaxID=200361 RepID=A0A453J8V3_AEGTS